MPQHFSLCLVLGFLATAACNEAPMVDVAPIAPGASEMTDPTSGEVDTEEVVAEEVLAEEVIAEEGVAAPMSTKADNRVAVRVRGQVHVEAREVASSFDATVTQMIRRRLRAMQRCYETELRQDPTLTGRVSVQFMISERGAVEDALASENTTGSPAVAACVVSIVRRFRFNPGPEGGSLRFSYSFNFVPQI